jgi:putative MATE family efflux protein
MDKVEVSPGRGSVFARDWTKGNVFRNLLGLSWPIIVTESFWVVGMTVDMIWVGKLGVASIAGVGVSGIIVMLLMAARWGLAAGTRAMIARFVGGGDREGANHVAQQAFVISSVYAIFVAVIGVTFAEPMLRIFGLEADVVAEGTPYLRLMFIGSIAMSFWMMAEGIMQASGDAMTPMKITIVARVIHLIIDPFLIFGWWVFPHLGVTGAATANLIAYSIGMTLGLWSIFSGQSRLRLTLRNFRLDPDIIWRIVKIGIPASVMGVQRTLGNLVLMWFLVPFGTLAVAAHTLCQRIEMILFMPSMGLGIAAGVLVGQNLGAHQPERAERSGWQAVGLIQVFMTVSALAILLWAEAIIGVFNAEPELLAVGSTFLRIAAAGYLVLGLTTVLMQVLSGAGDTLPAMLVSLAMVWAVQVPLAFFLPQVADLGANGVRWAIAAGLWVAAIAYIAYFRVGRWKHKRV